MLKRSTTMHVFAFNSCTMYQLHVAVIKDYESAFDSVGLIQLP